jgi:hypothetical protein
MTETSCAVGCCCCCCCCWVDLAAQGDMLPIAEAARNKGELMEGYKVIIDSLAGV